MKEKWLRQLIRISELGYKANKEGRPPNPPYGLKSGFSRAGRKAWLEGWENGNKENTSP